MQPAKRDTVKRTLRLPPNLWDELLVAAAKNRRSANMQIVVIIEEALADQMSWVAENHPPTAAPLMYPQDRNARLDEDYLPGDGVTD